MKNLHQQLSGKNITVMGLGRFGGALGLIQYLSKIKADITVTDSATASTLKESLEKVSKLPGVKTHIGEHPKSDFTDCDFLFVNPAVKPLNPFVALARKNGAKISTQIGLFLSQCPAKVIAVTGSSGKSTTCALIQLMLQNSGFKAFLGGNAGGSLLPRLEEIRPESIVVLELSSFQLHYLSGSWPSYRQPDISAVLNVHEDHLNWHKTFRAYAESKNNILRPSQTGDQNAENKSWAVVPGDDALILSWALKSKRKILSVGSFPAACHAALYGSEEISLQEKRSDKKGKILFKKTDMKIRGQVNFTNASFAAGISYLCGAGAGAIQKTVQKFSGLEYRMETISKSNGLTFVNSSIDTTPLEAARTLEAFNSSPIVLIAGGSGDKKLSFHSLAQSADQRLRCAVFTGETASQIKEEFEHTVPDVPCFIAANLEKAVAIATKKALPGDTVLFAPGCPSFDNFSNFKERGKAFCTYVKKIQAACNLKSYVP